MSPDAEIVLRSGARPPEDGWRHYKCPLCERRGLSGDRRGALSISSRGYYRCHRCASTGRLGERPSNHEMEPVEARSEPMRLPPHCHLITPSDARANTTVGAAAEYLLRRGLSWEKIQQADIQACVAGFYAGRVVVPVYGAGKKLAGFVARSWEPGAAVPYLYPRGMKRAELFYSTVLVSPAVVVEGVFDALHLHHHGLALLGKPSQWQLQQLCRTEDVAVCLDGDALDEGWSLALVLRVHGVRAGAIWLPPAKDPDEFPREVILDAARRCIDAPEPVRVEL